MFKLAEKIGQELRGETGIGDMNLGIISIWVVFEDDFGRAAEITQKQCVEDKQVVSLRSSHEEHQRSSCSGRRNQQRRLNKLKKSD